MGSLITACFRITENDMYDPITWERVDVRALTGQKKSCKYPQYTHSATYLKTHLYYNPKYGFENNKSTDICPST